jgi:polysaccharide biosynthesis protein PslF
MTTSTTGHVERDGRQSTINAPSSRSVGRSPTSQPPALLVRFPVAHSGSLMNVVHATPAADDRIGKVLVVGTFPPTECGLATYTANICEAIAGFVPSVRVVRLMDDDDPPAGEPVEVEWRRGQRQGLEAAISATSAADVVLLQHEFGIYPGDDGDEVLEFVERCERPIATVLHTVLDEPSDRQQEIVERIARGSIFVVVHSRIAKVRLLSLHDVDPAKVVVIPHGATPNLGPPDEGHPVVPTLLSWGLLGPGKGIERGIHAVAVLRRLSIDVRYVVAGETHPKVRAREGERYRGRLQQLAERLGVADLVTFDGGYRTWSELRALVRSATLVLLPYDSRDQVTSGVLVEALAAGKPVVATAFPHAIELSRTGAVVVVSHDHADRFATAVLGVLTDPGRMSAMRTAARREGANYAWPNVGRRFAELLIRELDLIAQPGVIA